MAFGQPSFVPYLGAVSAVVGYALFWKAIRIFPFKIQRFWRAWVFYAFVSIVQLSWMTAIEYQGIYILFVWLALSIGVGFQFGLLSVLIPYNRPLKFGRILAIASLWTLFEWSRYHFICGYSWNLSGMALSNPIAIQFAAIFGVLGLSFWVVLVNLAGLRAMTRRGILHYGIWAALAGFPYLFGVMHLHYHKNQMAKCEEKLSCLLVQTGVLPPEKIPIAGRLEAFISPYDQWSQILQVIQGYWDKKIDLLVLPESAVPFSLDAAIYDQSRVKEIFFQSLGVTSEKIFPPVEEGKYVSNGFWVQALSNSIGADVMIGLDYVDGEGAYNSAFFARPYQSKLHRYDKQILMPLAEYLPYKWLLPLVKAYGIDSFYTPGKKASLFEGKVPLSASICYEETFPEGLRQGRLLGARLFVNMTNDGWYPFSRLSSQHFEHARFRSVENGVPLLRACNTGVTAAVDSLGRTLAKLEEKNEKGQVQKGAIFAEILPYDYFTLFAIWGNSGILIVSFLTFGVFCFFKKVFHW